MTTDYLLALEAFHRKIEQAGLVTDSITADGEIHRCGTTGKEQGKDGAYSFHCDEPYAGWYKNFRTGDEGKWCHKGNISLSPEEREQLNQRAKQESAKRQAEREERHSEAAKQAEQTIANLPAANESNPYLTQKGVASVEQLYAAKDTLVVPVLNAMGEAQSLQHIYPDGTKRFLKGGKTRGGYFPIKGDNNRLFIVEGLATGLTVHEATGNTVLCAFNAGNLKEVALLARARYPKNEIVIAGDNDQTTENNPGLIKARAAASEIHAKLTIPSFPNEMSGSDFNDIHKNLGIDEVRKQLTKLKTVTVTAPTSSDSVPSSESMRPPEDFPFGIFPEAIESALKAAAKAFVVPLAVPAMAFLVAAAASIGRSRALVVKKSWKVLATLFVALVADSGMGKTPCTARIFKTLRKHDYEYYERYKAEKEKYDDLMSNWKPNKDQEKPAIPKQVELFVDDATMEKIAHILAVNPRGILWYRDELSGLIHDLGKYSKGGKGDGDKARLLSAYSGASWKASRATKDGAYVRAACITLFGTIQPQIILKCFEEADKYSGLLQRFIFINAEKEGPALWTDDVFNDEAAESIDRALEYLMGLKLSDNDNPCDVFLSGEGRAEAIKKFNNMEYEVENDPDLERFKSLVPKNREQMFKFCLILHMLDCWANGKPDTTPVSKTTVCKAIQLIDWIISHQRRAWIMLEGKTVQSSGSSLIKRVGKAIVELNHKTINGVLPTSDIAELLNADLPHEFQVTSASVGKSYRKLGLEAGRSRNGARGVSISPEQLKRLKEAYGATVSETKALPLTTKSDNKEQSTQRGWNGEDGVEI